MKRTYYNPPPVVMNTSVTDSARQPFNIEDPRANEIVPLSKDSCFTLLITMLFVIATIGGFIYINMYLMFDLYNVTISMKPGAMGMAPDSCSYYYCGQSANYFAHNRAAYDKCNTANCGGLCNIINNSSTINTMTTVGAMPFDCNSPTLLPVAFYYSCFSSCDNLVNNNVPPPQLYYVFIVGCIAGGFFALAILISLIYSILGCCCGA